MASLFPRMLQEDAEALLRECEARREKECGTAFTKKKAIAFAARRRAAYKKIFSLPKNKSPLRTEVTGEIQLERYTIEKIVFESRPGYFVTANRYLPKTKAPWPGAVISCGHSLLGKAYPDYQALAARLALGGFAVLIYDPVAQGERIEYPEHSGNCVREHIMLGKRQLLLGSSQGAWMAWDGIRALDCLLENKNVDPSRLAAIGQSGGGTLTSTLLALDDRYAFGVPSCFITDFRSNLHNELPTDSEQIPTGAAAQGLELYDLLAASAPRPILIAAVENDFFDVRGTERAFAFLKKLYKGLGKGADIRLHVSPGSHGIGVEARTVAGEFLFKKARLKSAVREEEIPIFSEEELWAVPGGSAVKARAGMRSLDLLKSEFLETKKTWRGFDAKVLKKLLGFKKIPATVPEVRVLRTYQISGRLFSRFEVNTERSVHALVKVLCESNQKPIFQFQRQAGTNGKARLYVGEGFLENELSGTGAFSEELKKLFPISGGENVFAVDVRGLGDSTPGTTDQNDHLGSVYGSDYFYSSWALLFGKTLAGDRVFDLLRVAQLLKAHGFSEIEVTGYGLGALTALLAAPFEPAFTGLKLFHMPDAYASLMAQGFDRLPSSGVVPGMLRYFDLPEIVAFLKKKISIEIRQPMELEFKT